MGAPTRCERLAALAAAVIVATAGVLATATIRGALPALAHVPWIGWAASRRSALVGVFIAASALAGQFAVLVGALAIAACASGTNHRDSEATERGEDAEIGGRWSWPLGGSPLLIAIAAGLLIGTLQWIGLHGNFRQEHRPF